MLNKTCAAGTTGLPSGKDSGPVAIYDKGQANTLVMSPLSNFMAGSVYMTPGTGSGAATMSYGVMGT